ncbi:hypothetical protein EXIGLDRAFT_723186 [Exidia glandulosa HHB12029]|uniref:C2H2-type domain-containing protein n=1 Tax=Exidia glandulosa HHB12029 TaxID=1314781 RepID=A0A165N0N7_EXIGL|nr:hypothetical protein EXIGLDRAFT_723186 [Exidia glandulosa HHB12029]
MSSHGQQGQQNASSSSSGYFYGSSSTGQQQQQQQQSQPPPGGQQPEPEWRCLKCGQYISSVRAEAEAHNRACNGRCIWVCKICRAEFEDSAVAEQHIYNSHWSTMRYSANSGGIHGAQSSWHSG